MSEGTVDRKEEENRESWSNPVEYLLTCIGYAVGLGNIWRFPKVAFENGGGSFLFVYLIISLLFGLPTLYMELSLGQFSRTGPAHAFGWVAPAFRGVGYAMVLMSAYVSSFRCLYGWKGGFLTPKIEVWTTFDPWAKN